MSPYVSADIAHLRANRKFAHSESATPFAIARIDIRIDTYVAEHRATIGWRGATHTRHGVASDYDPHPVEIERFIARIAQHLEVHHRAGHLSNLVLIAEPRLLGVLRARLPAEIHRLVTREIAGDYVHADKNLIFRVIDESEQR